AACAAGALDAEGRACSAIRVGEALDAAERGVAFPVPARGGGSLRARGAAGDSAVIGGGAATGRDDDENEAERAERKRRSSHAKRSFAGVQWSVPRPCADEAQSVAEI